MNFGEVAAFIRELEEIIVMDNTRDSRLWLKLPTTPSPSAASAHQMHPKFVVIPGLHLHPLVLYLLASNQITQRSLSWRVSPSQWIWIYTISSSLIIIHIPTNHNSSCTHFLLPPTILTTPSPNPVSIWKFLVTPFYLWSLKATTQRGPPCLPTITPCNGHLDLL